MGIFFRKRKEKPPAFPTFYPEELDEELPEDIFEESIHMFSEPTIMYKTAK